MLQKIEIQNYRSILHAEVDLKPFTILVGANGSGKSNFLRLLSDVSGDVLHFERHLAHGNTGSSVTITSTRGSYVVDDMHAAPANGDLKGLAIFALDPEPIGKREPLVSRPFVKWNGEGAVQVLDSLKTGDREDLFNTIERQLCDFVPEIEKLSFAPGENAKSLQVRERGIPTPIPVSELSEGTRLVLTILTIVHQERRPSVIGIEDIDRGLHPALFGKVVEVCRKLTEGGETQIIATTHNPYFVDQFVDDEDSVILVEKVNANTTFTPLSERLAELGARSDSLGAIWYSGMVGGVPKRELKHLPKRAG